MECEFLFCYDHIFRLNVYLINRVHSRQLPQSCHAEHFHDQVSPEQVRQHLEDLELGMAHPHFS